jgi:hypothetical protein
VPGGSTGLLVKTVRLIKVYSTTEDGQLQPTGQRIEVTEYALDVRLLREMREIEKQCAIEMREWQRTTGQKLNIDLERFTDEKLERVAAGEDPRLVRLRALLGRVEPANGWKN